MKDITLISVNWNNVPCMDLMLRSYARHHPGLNRLIMVDNASTDGSLEFLKHNKIPYIRFGENIGHEQALNVIFPLIKTKYALIVDTDIEFVANVHGYLDLLNDKVLAVGDLITGDQLHSPVKPRIGAWFFMFDVEAIRAQGITKFRDSDDWSYDVGSWMTEQILKYGFIHELRRHPGDIDRDIVGMRYDKFNHLGKMSWNLENHSDRFDEVTMRKKYVIERLGDYQPVDLNNRFYLL